MVQSMMSLTNLPVTFWLYVLESIAFTLSRVPFKAFEKTPYEMWTVTQALRRYDRTRHELERYGFLVTNNDDVM
ncbi:Retrovirus-related Pol polyprotein from transposon TNT 1-94 [Gossypium australe]|uniref:Retrovirus-related Pol polyprotein from transposon TNT 1-94 n=1 Tax=Gossypium australe TaxID=47621 RepID=A0A5B6WF18_9ROSI|nr:Retrovirus-related Pol polyprotein from transposon TNT 1-94 [Gossypium australe]